MKAASIKEVLARILNTPLVIESGTSGIWTYRKWSNGIAECWGTVSWTITSWTAWGGWYYSNASPNTNFPANLFIAAPVLTAIGRTSNGDVGTYWRSATAISATTAPTFGFNRPATGSTSITGYVYMTAKGRWKSGG